LPDCPAPVSDSLEQVFYPSSSTIFSAALRMLGKEDKAIDASKLAESFKGPY
jgi:pyruvate dehydrogenase E1 component beta subunit